MASKLDDLIVVHELEQQIKLAGEALARAKRDAMNKHVASVRDLDAARRCLALMRPLIDMLRARWLPGASE